MAGGCVMQGDEAFCHTPRPRTSEGWCSQRAVREHTASERVPVLLSMAVGWQIVGRRSTYDRSSPFLSRAPMIPNPEKIKIFRTEAAFEQWLRRNHARETEL